MKKRVRYANYWKCSKCKNLIFSIFYYVKECHDKYCKTCKEKIIKELPFACICGKTYKDQPIEIILEDFGIESDELMSSSNNESDNTG